MRESAHVYKQVCGANLRLNGRRYFSIPFKLGQSGSAALPLPRVPPFYFILCLFSVYTFFMRNPWCNSIGMILNGLLSTMLLHRQPTPARSGAEGRRRSERKRGKRPSVSESRRAGSSGRFVPIFILLILQDYPQR